MGAARDSSPLPTASSRAGLHCHVSLPRPRRNCGEGMGERSRLPASASDWSSRLFTLPDELMMSVSVGSLRSSCATFPPRSQEASPEASPETSQEASPRHHQRHHRRRQSQLDGTKAKPSKLLSRRLEWRAYTQKLLRSRQHKNPARNANTCTRTITQENSANRRHHPTSSDIPRAHSKGRSCGRSLQHKRGNKAESTQVRYPSSMQKKAKACSARSSQLVGVPVKMPPARPIFDFLLSCPRQENESASPRFDNRCSNR